MSMPLQTWVFNARLAKVVDGDTLDIIVDQGMHTQRLERVRLLGIDCPEVRGATHDAGVLATHYTRDWLTHAVTLDDWPLRIVTAKDPDHFGRYLALVWRILDGNCLNDDLMTSGNAVPFMSG